MIKKPHPDAFPVRELAAQEGWLAYYADIAAKQMIALPVIAWVTVSYPDEDDDGEDAPYERQEMRPFVLTASGRVIDMHEPEQDFVCLLGPRADHKKIIPILMAERYPDSEWAVRAVEGTMN